VLHTRARLLGRIHLDLDGYVNIGPDVVAGGGCGIELSVDRCRTQTPQAVVE
jgi:hypothetical protein